MIISLGIMLLIALGLYIYQTIQLADEKSKTKRSDSYKKELEQEALYFEDRLKRTQKVAKSRMETLVTVENHYLEEKRKRELYEKALQKVDPNKLCVVNQGHALGSTKLGLTTQGQVMMVSKCESRYIPNGMYLDETIGEGWDVAK